MVFYSIIIISLFAVNTRAADYLNVKDITDKFNVDIYNSPYNDSDKNVFYSCSISLPKALDRSHIAILYKKPYPFGYDSILVITIADCPDPVRKCGMLDIGFYERDWKDSFKYEENYRQNPLNEPEVGKYYVIDQDEKNFIARYLRQDYDKDYSGNFTVYIIPAVLTKTKADKFKDHFCPKQIMQALYIPYGNYSVLQRTAFYEKELKECEFGRREEPGIPQPGIPLLPIIIAIVLVVVVIIVIVMVVLFHRGVFGKRNQHDEANNQEQGIPLKGGETEHPRA